MFHSLEIGHIKAHAHHGLEATAIPNILLKPDGESRWCAQAVSDVLYRLEAEPRWRGERKEGTGKNNRKTAKEVDKAVVKEVLAQRGKKEVTVKA